MRPRLFALPIHLTLALTFFNFTGNNAMRVLLTLYALRIGVVEMPAERSQDIDSLDDFERCEAALEAAHGQ